MAARKVNRYSEAALQKSSVIFALMHYTVKMDAPRVRPTDASRPVATLIGQAYCIPTRDFLSRVLPPLPLDLNLDDLLEKGAFSRRNGAITKHGRLWGYGGKGPAGVDGESVTDAFAHLSRNIHSIVKTVKGPRSTLTFYNNKEGKANFVQRTTTTLPDAFFVLTTCMPNSIHWTDIAVFCEYRKKSSKEDIQENINKMSCSLLNRMRNNPRCRFAFAFTAEDKNMKLWYCDRQQIVVSETFNFVKDYRTLLQFVLSISFAQQHQLGWDPTMSIVERGGHVQYDITVRSRDAKAMVFRTIGILSDSGARMVVGRATRVWKVVQLIDGVETEGPVALKEAWVDSAREREGEVHSRVMQSIYESEQCQEANDRFITVLIHGDVHVADSRDHAPTAVYKDAVPSAHFTRSLNSGSVHTVSPHLTTIPSQVHYRIVYNEVGEPLSAVSSLEIVFQALEDVLQGLNAMHMSGWVHRDLSPGNILIVNGTGRLADLEGALNGYLFCPERKATRRSEEPPLESFPGSPEPGQLEPERLDPDGPRPRCEAESPLYDEPLRYNPLHDQESLWWITVYFTLNRKTDVVVDREAESKLAGEFFYDYRNRQDALTTPDYFSDKL
ncbi:hypothetical protein NM688_g5229 [Phlebia brevispora]|uniref:Uncharacterized protein n=1 Tax=Phlebia brevispora TaxID=194682 RepID=A0ACC1SYR7_9APHY|nr:hypothetical protein NM688_g5229 [Phlebia brevispora]